MTSLSLGAHFDGFIAAQLASGRYAEASEVVRDALRLLEDPERRATTLESAVAAGLDRELDALGRLSAGCKLHSRIAPSGIFAPSRFA